MFLPPTAKFVYMPPDVFIGWATAIYFLGVNDVMEKSDSMNGLQLLEFCSYVKLLKYSRLLIEDVPADLRCAMLESWAWTDA
jgi:hypothetical protein